MVIGARAAFCRNRLVGFLNNLAITKYDQSQLKDARARARGMQIGSNDRTGTPRIEAADKGPGAGIRSAELDESVRARATVGADNETRTYVPNVNNALSSNKLYSL